MTKIWEIEERGYLHSIISDHIDKIQSNKIFFKTNEIIKNIYNIFSIKYKDREIESILFQMNHFGLSKINYSDKEKKSIRTIKDIDHEAFNVEQLNNIYIKSNIDPLIEKRVVESFNASNKSEINIKITFISNDLGHCESLIKYILIKNNLIVYDSPNKKFTLEKRGAISKVIKKDIKTVLKAQDDPRTKLSEIMNMHNIDKSLLLTLNGVFDQYLNGISKFKKDSNELGHRNFIFHPYKKIN